MLPLPQGWECPLQSPSAQIHKHLKFTCVQCTETSRNRKLCSEILKEALFLGFSKTFYDLVSPSCVNMQCVSTALFLNPLQQMS